MNLIRWKSPTEARDDGGEFRYGILRGRTAIRLVQIQPGSGNKGISINLVDSYTKGTSRLEYDALSYTWGDGERDKSISCNGRRLQVTQTLLEALHRFRNPDHVVTLWIDQICICQDRHRERSDQVKLMSDIFKGARKVIVWLGDNYDGDESKAGMQLANQLVHIARHRSHVKRLYTDDLETHGLPRQGHKRWKALAAILQRPWFYRTWIVQEVCLNPNVELVLGNAVLDWDDLEAIVRLLEGPLPKMWRVEHAVVAPELPFSRLSRIRSRHNRHRTSLEIQVESDLETSNLERTITEEPEHIDGFESDAEDDDPELLDLLLMSRDLGATDPRDKIYALLGLGKHDVDVDYSMSTESVFAEFALSTIGIVINAVEERASAELDTSSSDRDVRRAIILICCAGRHNQTYNLPSWVPDWTTPLSARPLIFGTQGKRFSAGGELLGTFDWQPDSGLHLCGKLLDTVGAVGNVKLQWDMHDSSVNVHLLIKTWWVEANEIASARVVRSPGSTPHVDALEALRRDLTICKHGYYIGESKHRRRSSLLDDLELTSDSAHHPVQTMTLGPTRGRNLFVTASNYVGLAPNGTQEGDLVFVIVGVDVPFILRPYEDAYELIGEAYVQGIMNGEALLMEQLLVQDVMIR